MRFIDYLIARMKEEGTVRSLAICLVCIRTGFNTPEAWEAAIFLGIAVLSGYSAMKPAAQPPAPQPAGPSQ